MEGKRQETAAAIRWVLVRDPEGTFDPQALLCTDPSADPSQILEWFVLRWQLEVTFQEARTHLGMDSLESGQHLLDGFTITYNLFRDHEALGGRKPADAAKVNVPFKEWADFVKADIQVPPSYRKKVVKRGTPKAPIELLREARAKAETKEKRRKGKGRVRKPKVDYAAVDPTPQTDFKSAPKNVQGRKKSKAPQPVMPRWKSTGPGQQVKVDLFMLKSMPRGIRPKPAGAKRR